VKILHVGYGFHPWRFGGLILYAEDLMEEQVARGHEVAYFFSGRRDPAGPKDRLRRWARHGVAMREIVNSTLVVGAEAGTLTPDRDLSHPPSERLFERVLDELEPDLVHFQELTGLPTSVIGLARARGLPTVMTLQDYLPLCPVLKLYDVDGQNCLRRDVGAQCARCCAGAPATGRELVNHTVEYHARRALGEDLGNRVLRAVGRTGQAGRRVAGGPPSPGRPAAPAERYQARRDTNVERLSRLDAVVAQSHRLAEIYSELGVDSERIRVMQLTLRHIEQISAKAIDEPPRPVRFVTLNGCASVQKGRDVVIEALEILDREGLGGQFVLTVLGYVTDETRNRLAALAVAEYGGNYDVDALESVLEPHHVGIVPSIWEEAYGYVGVEFLAAGLPVIGNARGGIVEYTRDRETGWVNREASGAGLAEIMARIIREPREVVELNSQIRERRDQIIKPFDRHAGEMLELYEDLIREASGSLTRVAGD
jgi:glycosyltransferase involved in cell wall biosynthesis